MKPIRLAVLALALAAGSASAQSPATSTSPAPRTAAPVAPASPTSSPKAPLIDINSASLQELDGLPGVGPARSAAIVKGRPYRGKDDLLHKKIIPANVYEGIKDRIIAKQS